MSTPKRRSAAERRPHRVPPPVRWDAEPLANLAMLREAPDPLGPILWQTIQSVELWAEQLATHGRAETNSAAFAARLKRIADAPLPDGTFEPLVAAASVLSGGTTETIADALTRLTAWAESCRLPQTALACMQARAACLPADPVAAHEVARLAWASGDAGRAETWFRHALVVARAARDSERFCMAHLGLAKLILDRGNLPLARRFGIRGLRVALRHSLGPLRGVAHHEMAEICWAENRDPEALRHVRQALHFYGDTHPRLAPLACDVGYRWMLKGYFGLAREIFDELRPRIARPREQLFLAANAARAAAGAGDAEAFDRHAAEVDRLGGLAGMGPWVAQSRLEVAHGAGLLGRHEEALAIVAAVLARADEGGQHRVRHEAEALADAVRAERLAARARKPSRAASEVARELLASLHSAPPVAVRSAASIPVPQ